MLANNNSQNAQQKKDENSYMTKLQNVFENQSEIQKSTLWYSIGIFALSLSMTWFIWHNVSENTTKIAENRFNNEAFSIKNEISSRIENYQTVLKGVKGLVLSSDYISRKEFRTYIESLTIENKLSGIQAIGFAPYIRHKELTSFLKRTQTEIENYRLRPEPKATDEGHVPVFYNEPTKPSNLVALGFDMYSDPVRREALKKARETGQTSITSKIYLIQDSVKYPAFVLYMPIYKNHVNPPAEIKDRLNSHVGYAVIATRFKDLMDGIINLNQPQSNIEIEIFDGQIGRMDKLVFDSNVENGVQLSSTKNSLFSRRELLEVNGRTWLIHFMSSPQFERSIDRSAEISVIVSGILISSLLFTLVFILSRTRAKALNIANTMTSAFIKSENRYRQMFFKNQSVKLLIDVKTGVIVDANSAASIFYGYSIEQLKLMNIEDISLDLLKTIQSDILSTVHENGYYFKEKHKLSDGEFKDVEVYLGLVEIDDVVLLHAIIHDITQRIRIEEAKEKTETQLIKQLFFTQTLIDTLPNPIFYKDAQGRYLGCNKAFENFIGLPQDSIIGKTASDISPTELSKKYHEMDINLLQERGFQIYETAVRFADGAYRDVIMNKAVFYESNGQLGGLVGIIIDISERKQMEDRLRQVNDKLRDANEQLALVLEGSHDGFWDLDFSKRQIQMSQRLKYILGYSDSDNVPSDFDSWIRKIHKDDLEEAKQLFKQHVDHKVPYYFVEQRILTKSGEYKWVMLRGRVVKWDSFNQPLRCTGILSDISERKEFEEQLQRQKEFLRQVIDSDPNIIFVKNADGQIILTNESMAKLFETTVNNMFHKNSDDFMSPENALSCHETDQYVLMTNQVITTEEEIVAPSGQRYHFLITKKPLYFDDNSMQILAVGLNITESKKAEIALRESETRLREVTSSIGEAIYVMDSKGKITFCNPEVTKILGFTEQELLGSVAHELFHHTHDDGRPYPRTECHIAMSVMRGEEYRMVEDIFWTKDHRKVPVSVIAIPIIRQGQIEGGVVSFHDISKEIVIRQTLHQALLEQETILETMVVGMALICNRKITWINSRLEEMLGYDRTEVIDGTTEMFFKSKEKWTQFGEEVMPLLYRGEIYAGEHDLYRKDGEQIWCTLNGKMIDIDDPDRGVIWIIQDITQRKKFEEQIRYMAHYDALTKLPNRVMYKDRLDQALARAERNQSKLAVMFIDLDKFKYVNDTLGHGVGDKLLKLVSERLLTCVRRSDTVSRFGGDEFVILLPEIRNEEDVKVVAQKIIRQLTDTFIIDNHSLYIGCSIGIACYPKDGETLEELMKNADIAMYHVKENGRNNFYFFQSFLD